jgi:hypothetical protein
LRRAGAPAKPPTDPSASGRPRWMPRSARRRPARAPGPGIAEVARRLEAIADIAGAGSKARRAVELATLFSLADAE